VRRRTGADVCAIAGVDRVVRARLAIGKTACFGGHVIAFIATLSTGHECVEGRQSVAALPRQQKKCVIEIAVRRARDACTLRRLRDGIGDFFLVAGGRLRISCYEMSNQRAAEQTGLLAFADGRALVKRVVSASLDGVEDGEAAALNISRSMLSRNPPFRERRVSAIVRASSETIFSIIFYVTVVEAGG